MAQNITRLNAPKRYNRDVELYNSSLYGGPTANIQVVDANGNVNSQSVKVNNVTGGGLGYATGAGGAVTQGTSRTTDVTLDTYSGAITLFSAAGSATPATFSVNNALVDATDTILINQKSGTDLYHVLITGVSDGIFDVTFFTTGGTTTEQPVFNFSVIKAVAA